MFLFRRSHCFLRSSRAFHRGNTPVVCVDGPVTSAVGAAVCPITLSSQSRLMHGDFSTKFGATNLGESARRDSATVRLLAAQRPLQSMIDIQLFGGRAFFGGRRWLGTTYGRNSKQKHRGVVMKDFQTIEEAANAAFRRLEDLDPRSLSSFWTRVSQLVASKSGMNSCAKQDTTASQRHRLIHELESILFKTMGGVNSFGPRDLAQTALGIAKTARVVIHQRRLNGTQEILHGLLVGQQSQQKQIIFHSIAGASVAILSNFDARHLSNLAYANAIAGSVPTFDDGGTLFDHIAEKSIPLLRKFEPQNIANLVWSFEKVRESNSRLFEQVGDHIASLSHLGTFKPQAISNILLAFAKAGEPHPGLFKKVADHITSRDSLHSFEPQHLSNTVWAFAKAGEKQPQLFQKVADHIASLDSLHSFNPQNLSNTVWAFVKAREKHPRLFQKVADHIVSLESLHPFKPQEVSNTVWAFTTAGENQPRLFQRVANHIVALDDLHPFEPQGLSNTIWAFAKAGDKQPLLFQRVADHILALDNVDGFSSKHCSQLLWGFGAANVPHDELFARVAAHANEFDFETMDEEDRKMLLWAYEKAEASLEKKDDDDS